MYYYICRHSCLISSETITQFAALNFILISFILFIIINVIILYYLIIINTVTDDRRAVVRHNCLISYSYTCISSLKRLEKTNTFLNCFFISNQVFVWTYRDFQISSPELIVLPGNTNLLECLYNFYFHVS